MQNTAKLFVMGRSGNLLPSARTGGKGEKKIGERNFSDPKYAKGSTWCREEGEEQHESDLPIRGD